MFIPKKYGQSRIDKCPFCDKHATILNKQKIPVCNAHKALSLDDLKCSCGSTLETMNGKFGVFFSCIRCGNINLKKAVEINNEKLKPKFALKAFQKETIVRSDDPRYFD